MKLKAEVWERPGGFVKFVAVLYLDHNDPGCPDPAFKETIWSETFQGRTQAEGALKLEAKRYLKLKNLTVPCKIFEQEWELQ